MPQKNPKVVIVLGSTKDREAVRPAWNLLESFSIPFKTLILSAHRTPQEVAQFATHAKEEGVEVIIAAAGKAAHLPGVIKSYTTLPVIGLPLAPSLLGLDALLSMVQMPKGVPVATVGIDASENAALLAVEILALKDKELEEKLVEYRQKMKEEVLKENNE